jgi:DNA-binding NtrC family response regulator
MGLRRIVAVSKNEEIQQLARRFGQDIFVADDLNETWDIVQNVSPDLILLDQCAYPLAGVRDFLDRTYKNRVDTPLVVIGGDQSDTDLPAEFIQRGACDYLQGKKDYPRLEQIANRLQSNSKAGDTEKGPGYFFAEDYAASAAMVGRSKAMLNTLRMIKLVAASRCNPVLVVGETGTGKELVAKAIHHLRHPDGQFVAVNCAALTANLLESELFGHVKGSFTGADREKTGLLELTASGTILLDEITEMPLELQAKLLRVLQEKNFRKVGGIKNITCHATIMASSNRNLKYEVQANRFRRDLYYRLNICPINVAPLRSPDRRQDIPLLAEYFLKTSTICPEKVNKITSLTKLAIETLQKQDWLGNVRELRNVIEKAILLETTDKIGLSSIEFDTLEHDHNQGHPLCKGQTVQHRKATAC